MVKVPEFDWPRQVFRWVLATAITALVTAGLVLLHADSGTAGILYLVLVVWAVILCVAAGKFFRWDR